MINKVILVGRLGHDPEVRYNQQGQMITILSVATDESYKKDGEKITKTEWHKIITYGKIAEICAEYLKKGSLIFIEGKLQTRSWDDKNGNKRYTTEVVANSMKMLDGKKQEDAPTSSQENCNDDVPF